ncbi:MAG: hypothetical protein IJX69_00185 [Oscillospiraceae bacterium]|nr:hypothetical protein [Oscillospiraceae bacterium]
MRYRTIDLFDAIEDNRVQLEPQGVGDVDRILALTMAKIGTTEGTPHPRRRSIRTILLAAVIAALLMGTVFACVGFTRYENAAQMLNIFFGSDTYGNLEGGPVHEIVNGNEFTAIQPTVERVPIDETLAQDQVAPNVAGVGQSISYDGYTLTVTAHLHDPATGGGIIYYTLENPKGVKGYALQYDNEVWWPEGEKVQFKYCFDKSYIVASETTDTKLTVASYYGDTDLFDEDYIEIGFYWSDEFIRLELDYGVSASQLTSESGEIVITSTGMEICLQNMEFLYITDTDGTILPPMDDNHVDYLAIRFRDGTEYIVQQDRDGILIHNFTAASVRRDPTYVSYVFNRLVDISQVETVIINDVEFGFPSTQSAATTTKTAESGKMVFDQSAKSGHIARGNLHHEILDIRVVTNAADIPEGGRFAEYMPACTYDATGNETRWHYPEFIQEDGSFVEHVRLVLLEVEITSDNARNWTVNDRYTNGGVRGLYEDPYVFHIDGEYWLRETDAPEGQQPMNWTPCFFVGTDASEVNPRLYRIEPGETKRFTLGYLIGNDYDGSPRALSSLCIRVPFGLLENKDYSENFFPLA